MAMSEAPTKAAQGTPLDAPSADRQRRLRGRNIATLAALLGLVALFYLITIVRMGGN